MRHALNSHLSEGDKFSWKGVLSIFQGPKKYIHAVIQFSVDLSLFGSTHYLSPGSDPGYGLFGYTGSFAHSVGYDYVFLASLCGLIEQGNVAHLSVAPLYF